MDLGQFKQWALSQGTVGKFTDGEYIGECVSLINQYLGRVYGIRAGAWGHAKDWATNGNVAQYFDKVSSIQPGDIIVYPGNFGGGYGHIAIALGDGLMLDQNGAGNGRIAVRGIWSGYSAILRRKGTNQGGSNVSQYTTTVEDAKAVFDYWLGDTTSGRWNEWVGQPLDVTVKLVSSSAEAQGYAPTRLAKNDRIAALEAENAALKANPGDADSKKYTALKASVKELLK